MWRFDPIKNEWISCQKLLRKRAFHISVSVQSKMSSNATNKSSKLVHPLDIIFLFYGLCYSEGSTGDALPLKQCLSIEFYNLETDQWSLLKSTSNTLLDHQIFQTINYQNRLVLTGNAAEANAEAEPVNNSNLLNQLIEHQLSQSTSIITLKNLIYILKENCINCYEFDLTLEQLVCLPYFRLPSNLSSFVLAAAFPVKTLPTSTLSLFSWNCESDEDESAASLSERKSHNDIKEDDLDSIQEECDEQMTLQSKKEVVIYLLNTQAGILYQFYPAKNKLKKMPNLLLKHSTNETALLYIKSKLYVTGGICDSESSDDATVNSKEAATAIEVFDEDRETWSVFMDKIDTRVSPSSSAFSLGNNDSESASNDSVKLKKHFFKLKMSLV